MLLGAGIGDIGDVAVIFGSSLKEIAENYITSFTNELNDDIIKKAHNIIEYIKKPTMEKYNLLFKPIDYIHVVKNRLDILYEVACLDNEIENHKHEKQELLKEEYYVKEITESNKVILGKRYRKRGSFVPVSVLRKRSNNKN